MKTIQKLNKLTLKKNVGRKSNILFILFFLVAILGCAVDPISSTISTITLSKSVEETVDQIDAMVGNAIHKADYITENRLRTIKYVALDLAAQAREEVAMNRQFASVELTENAAKLKELITSAQIGVTEVDDLLVLDVQDIINQLPFKKDKFLVRRIVGYGLSPIEKGLYQLELTGNVFQPGGNYIVVIDNKRLDTNNIKNPAAHMLYIDIPSELINHLFLKSDTGRLPIKISAVNQQGKEIFEFSESVLLLPKKPVSYKLTEFKTIEKKDVVDFFWSTVMPQTGKNGVWKEHTYQINIEKPGELFTKATCGTPKSHSKCYSAKISDGGKSIVVRAANQCHDCTRTVEVSGKKERVIGEETVESVIYFKNNPRDENFISYGNYSAILSPSAFTWELNLEYFTGKKVSLNSKTIQDGGVRVVVENIPEKQFYKLNVALSDPQYGKR